MSIKKRNTQIDSNFLKLALESLESFLDSFTHSRQVAFDESGAVIAVVGDGLPEVIVSESILDPLQPIVGER